MELKIIKILVAFLVILALLIAIPVAMNHFVWHRSLKAGIFELELRLSGRDDAKGDTEAWVAEKVAENSGQVVIPRLFCTTDIDEYEGMYYVTLNAQEYPNRRIVYFPGGTYIDLPSDSHWYFAAQLAYNTNAEVIVPLYPRLPDNTAEDAYPLLISFYEDVVLAKDCVKLLFMGDSAGGGMALALAETLRGAEYSGPDRLILISPWVDVTMSNPELSEYEKKDPKLDRETLKAAGELWAGDGLLTTTSMLVSPLYCENLNGLGEICLYAGTRELLYPDIVRLYEKLEDTDTEHSLYIGEGMNHIWPIYYSYGLEEAWAAVEDIEENILK